MDDPLVEGRPLSSLKVTDLKEMLGRRNLSKSGVKSVLAERLREHVQSGGDAPAPLGNGTTSAAAHEQHPPVDEQTPTGGGGGDAACEQRGDDVDGGQQSVVRDEQVAEHQEERERPATPPAKADEEEEQASRDTDADGGTEQRSANQSDGEPQADGELHAHTHTHAHVLQAVETVEEAGATEAAPAPAAPPADEDELNVSVEPDEDDDTEAAARNHRPEEEDEQHADDHSSRPESQGSDHAVAAAADDEQQHRATRKRPWGRVRRAAAPLISTDSLKDIIKDVPATDTKLEEPGVELDYDEDIPSREVAPKRIVVAQEDEPQKEEPPQKEQKPSPAVEKNRGRPTQRRTDEPRIDDDEKRWKRRDDGLLCSRSPSPARHPHSKVIHIRCLQRPLALHALHSLLAGYGEYERDTGFWIDRIRSQCIVSYKSEPSASLARDKLHNVHWPDKSHKALRVDFSDKDQLRRHRDEEQATAPPTRPLPGSAFEDRHRRLSLETAPSQQVREWDRDKRFSRGESPPVDDRQMQRETSPRPAEQRFGLLPKRTIHQEIPPAAPAKTLDELFNKTKVLPALYWQPVEAVRGGERAEQRRRDGDKRERKSSHGEDKQETAPPPVKKAAGGGLAPFVPPPLTQQQHGKQADSSKRSPPPKRRSRSRSRSRERRRR